MNIDYPFEVKKNQLNDKYVRFDSFVIKMILFIGGSIGIFNQSTQKFVIHNIY